MIKETEHNGVKLWFDEEAHKYTTEKVKDFTSATTLIKDFFIPFDKEGISKKYAEKRGLKQEDVLAAWEEEGEIGGSLGDNVHNFCENYLLDKPLPEPVSEKAKKLMMQAEPALESIRKNYTDIKPECLIFSEKLKLAGMVDFTGRKIQTGVFHILDWKTNKKIVTTNWYKKFGKEPIDHLDDNNYTHYSLQLNIYEFLMKYEGYIPYDEIVNRGVIHFRPHTVDQYPIDDLSIEVEMILRQKKLIA